MNSTEILNEIKNQLKDLELKKYDKRSFQSGYLLGYYKALQQNCISGSLEEEEGKDTYCCEVTSFNIATYSLDKDVKYCHWSEGLKMIIKKDGVVIKLEGEEIEQLVKSLPKTTSGRY